MKFIYFKIYRSSHDCTALCMMYYNYIQYRGIVLKDCYADFDRHHIGLVTQSQVSIILLMSCDYIGGLVLP